MKTGTRRGSQRTRKAVTKGAPALGNNAKASLLRKRAELVPEIASEARARDWQARAIQEDHVTERTSASRSEMSALPLKADILSVEINVRFVP